jgi:hypothetical protein
MIKMYQKEWHGIDFKSFSTSDINNIPGQDFYDDFYHKFFNKFSCFDDLDPEWVDYKIAIAKKLIREIGNKKNILSIGCGIGIVEEHIAKKMPNTNLVVTEPSANVSRWISGVSNIDLIDGYFPEALSKNLRFDMAFANGIDYVFNNNEYETFLKSIVGYGIKEFVMVSVSYYRPGIKSYIKQNTKKMLNTLGLYSFGQFWGYMRTIDEQKKMLFKAGFSVVEVTFQSNDTIIIKANK